MTEAEVLALPKPMLERLQYVYRCATVLQSAWQLWHVHLNPADHAMLGGDFEGAWRAEGTFGLWMKARSTSYERAVLDVGFKLGFLLTGEYESFLRLIGEHSIECAELRHLDLARYQLVITEYPRRVFWRGTLLPINWEKQSAAWDYLNELVDAHLRGEMLDHITFGSKDPGALSKQKSRLSLMAGMEELVDRIDAAGRGSQRLDVPVDQIKIVRMADRDDSL